MRVLLAGFESSVSISVAITSQRKNDFATMAIKKLRIRHYFTNFPFVMNYPTEVTAKNLKLLRSTRGLKQEEVAAVLGLEKHNISKIETGKRSLLAAEKALLDLYFFGIIPFEIVNEKIVNSVLDFTTDQWNVITILSARQGISAGKWIANQIRSYLAFNEEAKIEQANISRARIAALPHPGKDLSNKVAEEAHNQPGYPSE